jgi:hypothetical protein
MKTNKPKKEVKNIFKEEIESVKPKKKMNGSDQKINLKSNKFWEELYEDEGDEIQKFLR